MPSLVHRRTSAVTRPIAVLSTQRTRFVAKPPSDTDLPRDCNFVTF